MPEKAMDEDTERQGVAIKHEGFCLKDFGEIRMAG